MARLQYVQLKKNILTMKVSKFIVLHTEMMFSSDVDEVAFDVDDTVRSFVLKVSQLFKDCERRDWINSKHLW